MAHKRKRAAKKQTTKKALKPTGKTASKPQAPANVRVCYKKKAK